MSRIYGRRSYATGTYPTSAGNGGGGAAIVPLKRQRFIDGDTSQTGETGSAAEPFSNIALFIASRPNVSDADNGANYVGWIMPKIGGYTENVAFPPYASTELRADSFGLTLNGAVAWENIAGTHSGDSPTVVMHNVSVTGAVTVTDDADAQSGTFVFGGDEVAETSTALAGGFDSHTTVNFVSAAFTNAVIGGNINCGTTADSATLFLGSCLFAGDGSIAAKGMEAIGSSIAAASITVGTGNLADFSDCRFGSAVVLTAGLATFDGPSWRNFVEAGGTRAPAASDLGTPALVVGGYSGGAVEGAVLPATGAASVSLSGTDAGTTVGYKGSNSGNHYSTPAAGLTGAATVNLLTGGALPGDTILITRAGIVGAFTLTVHNSGPGANTIAVVPVSARGSVLAQFNGTDWVFVSGGSLLA